MTSTPLSSDGEQALRELVSGPNGFRYLAALDANGNIATSPDGSNLVVDIVGDSRGSWGPASDNPVVAAVSLTGTDGDVDSPQEVSGTALLRSETDDLSNDVHTQTFNASNLIVDGSGTAVLEHAVEIPDK